jgi:hypothetical protein
MTEIPDCTFGDMSRALFALQEENKALRARLVEAMQVSNQHCFNHDKAARRLTTITEENETLRALLAMYETPCECCGAAILRVESGRKICVQGCVSPAETT